MPFIGKVILITGANSGIGAACSEFFANKGALLALVGRNPDKFEQVMEKIQDSGVEMEPLVILADVTTDAERIISETIEKYGRLDILINNAGFGIFGSIETTKMEDFDAIMATNVRAVFELTQLAVPHLIESKGCIVNVSSVCSNKVFKNSIAYCMSKATIDHFTRCSAIELADRGVRVNAINPGFIETDFLGNITGLDKSDEAYEEYIEQGKKSHPIGRIGQTQDCVNAIAFLAKDSASFITSITLPVDGGKANLELPF